MRRLKTGWIRILKFIRNSPLLHEPNVSDKLAHVFALTPAVTASLDADHVLHMETRYCFLKLLVVGVLLDNVDGGETDAMFLFLHGHITRWIFVLGELKPQKERLETTVGRCDGVYNGR